MTPEDPHTTAGKTRFYQGENNTQPLFCIEPGIPCQHAREQSSELMDCVRHLTLVAVMESDPRMVWAAHYLSALAKALMDDAELGHGALGLKGGAKRPPSLGPPPQHPPVVYATN